MMDNEMIYRQKRGVEIDKHLILHKNTHNDTQQMANMQDTLTEMLVGKMANDDDVAQYKELNEQINKKLQVGGMDISDEKMLKRAYILGQSFVKILP